MKQPLDIQAIMGLGNPGRKYYYQRHNIGFRIVDALAERYGGTWQEKDVMQYCTIDINNNQVILIKPQTFMNSSGRVIPFLLKKGIRPEQILVVHDELEKPFGNLSIKVGGSARGHNGLRSIIEACGQNFARLRFGIGRPANKEDVPDYVLHNFAESLQEVDACIDDAVAMIEKLYN